MDNEAYSIKCLEMSFLSILSLVFLFLDYWNYINQTGKKMKFSQ